MYIDELDAPAVVIDIEVMDRNLTRFASYCREHKLSLRPRTKTPKITCPSPKDDVGCKSRKAAAQRP